MSLILLWNYKNLKINHNLKLPLLQTRVKLLEGRDGTWRSEVALFLGKKFDWAGSHLTFYKTGSGSSWNKKITPKPLRLISEIWPVSKHKALSCKSQKKVDRVFRGALSIGLPCPCTGPPLPPSEQDTWAGWTSGLACCGCSCRGIYFLHSVLEGSLTPGPCIRSMKLIIATHKCSREPQNWQSSCGAELIL